MLFGDVTEEGLSLKMYLKLEFVHHIDFNALTLQVVINE